MLPVFMSEIPFGAFRQIHIAVCCAHNLFAFGERIPHLQPEKYVLSGTRPDRTCFGILFFCFRRKLCGAFLPSAGSTVRASCFFYLEMRIFLAYNEEKLFERTVPP